jgi:NAD(P)-dependent dehydrogenase (short-subunit alcohol dehydrogenase family)
MRLAALHSLLDRSVVFSFDRTGFYRHQRGFADAPERDLNERDVLVTGGSAGIGLSAAHALAKRGARPLLWARNPERGQGVARAIGGVFTAVDLGDLDAVGRAARALEVRSLAAVVLNAGAMPLERITTPQGHELIWASQVLGHALLLRILRRRGLLGSDTRVVWVSSGGMYTQRLDLHDLRRAGGYKRHTAYANAKRAQVELSAHFASAWPEVPQAAMHPGWVDTEAVQHSMPVFRAVTAPILRHTEQGADTIVWLVATRQPWDSGRFWFDRTQVPVHLSARTHSRTGDRQRLVEHVFAATDPFLEAP